MKTLSISDLFELRRYFAKANDAKYADLHAAVDDALRKRIAELQEELEKKLTAPADNK